MGATCFSGELTSQATIADVLDKGSGALIILDGEFLCVLADRTFIVLHNHFKFICFHHFSVSSLQVASQAELMKINLQSASAGIEIME